MWSSLVKAHVEHILYIYTVAWCILLRGNGPQVTFHQQTIDHHIITIDLHGWSKDSAELMLPGILGIILGNNAQMDVDSTTWYTRWCFNNNKQCACKRVILKGHCYNFWYSHLIGPITEILIELEHQFRLDFIKSVLWHVCGWLVFTEGIYLNASKPLLHDTCWNTWYVATQKLN